MRVNFSIAAFLLLVGTLSCQAQMSPLDTFSHLGERFDKQWTPGTFRVTGDAFAGSSSLNVKMFNDILFRSSFSNDAKSEFVENSQKANNTLTQSSVNVEFKIDSKWAAYANYSSINALKINNDFSKLVFFGNAAYEDETITTERSKYLSATTTTIGATRNLLSSDKWSVKTGFGMQVVSKYREISAEKLGLYTAPNGNYLDIEASGLSISEASNGLQAIGLSGDFSGNYTPDQNSSLSLSIKDLNVLKLQNKTRVDLDSSFRFTGIYVDVLNDSSNFVDELDSTYNSIITRSRKEAKWLTLPSTVTLFYQKKLSKKATGSVAISTIGLGTFGISAKVGVHYIFTPNFVLFSALGYGNFTGLQWREAVEYKRGRSSIYASVIGLQFVAISKLTNSYGASLGYAYTL